MYDRSAVTTFLFTDIEGSSRLWESGPTRMEPALARHDALARTAIEANRGTVVKMTGDGVCATFADSLDAIGAAIELQRSLADPAQTAGVELRVRCGVHVGIAERRDDDFFGGVVNRAARIMGAAHGGQILLSQATVALAGERLPQGITLRDMGVVRLRDLTSAEHVYQVLHPQLRQDFPALRSLTATPNNLPQQVTSFVGREHELAAVRQSLAKGRLVTLLGTGGLGKTRLSLHVAADLLDDFPDGVWLVELAPLNDPRRVPQAVASVLGVKEETGRPVQDALVKFVRDRRLLIVLDNCEHLVHACADLAHRLLQSGLGLKILSSSREPLHVAGEATYSLHSLAVPDPREKASLATAAQFEAIHLFAERAAAAQPAFRLTEQNAAAVVDICQRLDGIPLAIELAAARVRALSVHKIAERLSDRFRLLTGGDRTALPRQQTLRASIDWSYDLLADDERALLRRLAVFAGGWTIEAVEAVGAGGAIVEEQVLDVLTRLVEKSLVALEAEGTRYRLLETVRQYAQERLDESGDGMATRTRHLGYYVAFAEEARSHLFGPEARTWLPRLDFERENLLMAHAWCDHADNGAELGLRLVSAVKPYWFNRGLLGLGYRVTVEALAREGAQGRTLARCRGLFDAGQICFYMARYDEAVSLLDESLATARELGDSRRITAALQPLGMACIARGDLAAARRHLEEGLALARGQGDKRQVAASLNALGQLCRVEDKLDEAEALCAQMLALARDLGDQEFVAIGLLNLAMLALSRGAGDRARRMLLDVLAIARETGSRPAGQSVLEVSAGLAALCAQWDRAVRLFSAAEQQASNTSIRRDPADEAFLAPLVAKARVALDTEAFAFAEAAGRALSYDEAIADARDWLERST